MQCYHYYVDTYIFIYFAVIFASTRFRALSLLMCFTDVQDSVRCFQCGVGLREWDPGDDPWVEHARWMPNCAFILSNTSQEFINQVKAAVNRDKVYIYISYFKSYLPNNTHFVNHR